MSTTTKTFRPSRNSLGFAAALSALLCCSLAQAHPYASGITNNSGTIQFILNENADDVKVAFDNQSLTNDLGALNKGTQSFALGTHTNFAIMVTKVGAGSPSLISADTNVFVQFGTPRGVLVNRNPARSRFGRIYVANAGAGAAGTRGTLGDGLYILNADQSDALGKSNTVSDVGVDWGTDGANAPWKLGIDRNDNVYIGNFGLTKCTLWVADPNLSANAQNVLDGLGVSGAGIPISNHGRVASKSIITGSLATGDLAVYYVDDDIAPYQSVLRFDIGAGPLPYTGTAVPLGNAGIDSFAGVTADMTIAPDGKLFTMENRSAGTDTDSIRVFDSDKTTQLWGSLAVGGSPDPLRIARGISVSSDNKFLAIVHDDNHISILPLTNGVPDLANLSIISNTPSTTLGRDLAFDAADNVYTVSSGQGVLRVYSLGLTTTAITRNDATTTNGTFALDVPSTTVSVLATKPLATEAGLVAGEFTITRVSTDLSGPLTVNFTMGGTATNGVNYNTTATNSVVIPAGQTSVKVTITPIEDHTSDPTLTVTIAIRGGGSYAAVAPSLATVAIADDGPQLLVISVTSSNSMYEAITNDYATFTVTRLGDTNAASYSMSSFNYSGTAVPNVDFVPFSGSLTFDPGMVSTNLNISPLHNPAYTGNKTLTVAVGAGSGYTAGTATASATIIDAEYGPEQVLFADTLANGSSSNSWNLLFGSNNGIPDYTCTFGFSFADDSIPPAPNGSATGLKVTVNKDDPTANGAAGLNLYPKDKIFSGNYALRFSMCLIQNDTSGTTEFVTFGVNHSGTHTNWFIESGDFTQLTPVNCDGLWYAVVSDASGSAPADYTLFTGNGATNGPLILQTASATSFQPVFKQPPYTSGGGAGSPGNLYGNTVNPPVWSDVEIRQLGTNVSLWINKTPILKYSNTTTNTQGDIMLGYNDPYLSIGAFGGAVYYSNVRVVALGNPLITAQAVSGSNFNVTFTDQSNDPASSFRLLGSSLVGGSYTNMNATITQSGIGTYSATTAFSSTNTAKFFRVQHVP
jgi:hypothetical protein